MKAQFTDTESFELSFEADNLVRDFRKKPEKVDTSDLSKLTKHPELQNTTIEKITRYYTMETPKKTKAKAYCFEFIHEIETEKLEE